MVLDLRCQAEANGQARESKFQTGYCIISFPGKEVSIRGPKSREEILCGTR